MHKNPSDSRSQAPAGMDGALVLLAKAGDRPAFEELYRRTIGRIYRLVAHIVGNAHEAEDVTQEAYFQMYRALPGFEGRASFFTWAFRIAMHVSLQHVRSRTRRSRRLPVTRAPESSLSAPSPASDPERELERRRLYSGLSASIARLTPGLRAVIVLGPIQGNSYLEMGRTLGTSTDVVKGRLHRARESLRRLLTDLGVLPDRDVTSG